MTETDSVSETLYSEEFKRIDGVRNNSHVYYNTPLSEAFSLNSSETLVER